MRGVFFLITFSFPFSLVSVAGPLPSALDVLNKMSTAIQSLNYYGTLVYLHDGQVEAIQLVHKRDSSGEFERLVHLSGAAREVIRDNNKVTCYLPDTQSVIVGERLFNNRLLAKLATNFREFGNTYTFTVNGIGRVAGLYARIIEVTPKDAYRYGYRLWVAQESGLPLQTQLLNINGEVLEQIMFAKVDIVETIPASMLKPTSLGKGFTWYDTQKSNRGGSDIDQGWKITFVPVGFSLSGHYKHVMPNSQQAAEHLVISDGLATVSVYIETFNAESQPFIGASRMGAVNIYGSVLDDYQVTVVGEVPESTVRMIAQSVRYQPQPVGRPR